MFNLLFKTKKGEEQTDQNHAPIFCAITQNNLVELKDLISDPTAISVKNATGQSPLIFACERGNQQALDILLTIEHDIEEQDFFGFTPLMTACKHKQIDIVKKLLAAGAKPNTANLLGRTALMLSCAKGEIETVKLLLENGANANQTDSNGRRVIDYVGSQKIGKLKSYKIIKIISNAPGFYQKTKTKKTKPALSFAELIGKHAKNNIGLDIGVFIMIHSFVMFSMNFDSKSIVFLSEENTKYPSSIFVILPFLHLIFMLYYFFPAYKIIKFKPSDASNNRLNNPLPSAHQYASNTEYIQTLLDFGFHSLTNKFIHITDPTVIRAGKLNMLFPSAVLLLAILNGVMMAFDYYDFLVDCALAALFICLLGIYFEYKRRKKALVCIHKKLDKAAGDMLSTQQKRDGVPPKEFILYLRAFETTGALKVGDTDFETAITHFLSPHILLITFGVPGEFAGAARVQSTEEKWQSNVLDLMHRATHILMLPSDRPGTLWEAAELKKHQLLFKTTFVMLPEIQLQSAKYSELWQRAYAAFQPIGLNIPQHMFKGLVFNLNPAGHVQHYSILQEADLFIKQFSASAGGDGNGEGDGEGGSEGDGGGDGGGGDGGG
ncbi:MULTISPECIES: ankyrin repeat domain-containing protein [Aliiglaciecola]|uniref:ankyrin repeat domain-containing protein n=1 Tax=Aliiglaciecola TaxID=1406885 RepID=UPI001C088D75|nr:MULTISPECIES: ankyrin repeat domain-containing protein [Aliiglaciecola]MBU2878115.1 ankyrin repeat domain-containing protein [Aliiglaciecola lipolytica]MDO6711563.1 ankyrin repeat domain-containing protein [Aliiglaciecola sp. 2_MG-2023]MDO6752634.1 ankyrin repeat domain-containing protein [Aliiglaciecola sp. 1_MG-2023]